MKLIALILFAILASGCATTSLTVTTPEGLIVKFRFPKNLAADKLAIKVGDHSLEATNIRTDAAIVISAQGEIVADVTAAAVKAALSAGTP